jgi:hypothetical protein
MSGGGAFRNVGSNVESHARLAMSSQILTNINNVRPEHLAAFYVVRMNLLIYYVALSHFLCFRWLADVSFTSENVTVLYMFKTTFLRENA